MRIIVKAILDDQKTLNFRIKKTSLLEKLFTAISEKLDTPVDLLRFTYKGQSLKGTDTIVSTNMNVEDGKIAIHALRTDSSAADVNQIEIPQEPVTDTNDTVMVEPTNVNDDTIAQKSDDVLNRLETPIPTSSPKKGNIENVSNGEQICENQNPLKRKCNENDESSMSKVCKVEPLMNFQAKNLLISNLIADVNEKKVVADEALKKIPELEMEVVNVNMNMNAMEVTHANDLNTIIERHRLAIEALKESNQCEINDLKKAHRKVLDNIIAEKNSFVDTQSQTIDLMKQSMMRLHKNEMETMKEQHRKEINDKEESHRKSLVELTNNNNEALQKLMAEKFQVIESQNQHFNSVKEAFADEKQRSINERKNIEKAHDEKMNSLKKEMDNAIDEMVQAHNTKIQTLKDSFQNQLDETNRLKNDVIKNLAAKLDEERRFYCDQISQLKDDIEEQKESHQKQIVDLKEANSKALTSAKASQKNNIGPESLELVKQLEIKLTEKSKFHNENVQNIIKKCEMKRMKDISELKSELKIQAEANAIETKRLIDEIEKLKNNCDEIERVRGQHDAERAEWNRESKKFSLDRNELQNKHDRILQALQQKLDQKSVECEKTTKELNDRKIAFETEMKTSKENHIRTVAKLQLMMKNSEEINTTKAEELQKLQNRINEFEKKTTELQNERMKFVNEINHLRMNCDQPGKEQAMLAEINRLKGVEQSFNRLTEQHSILHTENINFKSSHQQLDQLLNDKIKALQEFQEFHKKRVDQLQAECDGHMANLRAKTVEIDKLKDMRRVEEDVRNAAHQNEILNLIGQHRQELETVRSGMERKIKESSGSQQTATPTPTPALALANDFDKSSLNEQNGDEILASSSLLVSSTQLKAEPKVRKCCNCGGKARFVTSYSYCSPLCNAAYCLKKTNKELEANKFQPSHSAEL